MRMGRERVEGEERRDGSNEGGVGGDADPCGHRLLDRSKVRILLCDNDPKSSKEVLKLLLKCSYQVTFVRSARQVIDVLNAQGSEIDIILAEIELPMAKGLRMLKYITRNKELRHIPIITMSAQDEVSVVIKCLRHGAADYLMKPLRTNELLNLWTHMWRRRCMFGLTEKDVFTHEFEMPISEPSDVNTNSTTLISDDTDDKHNTNANPESNMSNHRECESNVSPIEPLCNGTSDYEQNIPRDSGRSVSSGKFSSPKKIQLKVGGSSAFLTYVKSSALSRTQQLDVDMTSATKNLNREESSLAIGDTSRRSNKMVLQSHVMEDGIVTSDNICNRKDFQIPSKCPVLCPSSSSEQPQSRKDIGPDVSAVPPVYPLPFYYPGVVEGNIISPAGQVFQSSLSDVQAHHTPSFLSQYSVAPHMPMMPSYAYQSFGMNLQSGHMAAPSGTSSMTSSSVSEVQCSRTEKRTAALVKFRQKRKDRCFDKKIRYVNRKRLAEKRPRVRGQFVKQVNNVDLNKNVSGVDCDSEDEEYDEPTSKELELISYPEKNACGS